MDSKMRMLQGQDLRVNEFNNGFIYQFCRFSEVSSEQRPPAGEAGISERATPTDRMKILTIDYLCNLWLQNRGEKTWHSYLR
jgi:hypothetical protein